MRAVAGWTRLLGLGLRRDRYIGPITLVSFAVIAIINQATTVSTYATEEAREAAPAGTAANTAYVFLLGPLEHHDSVAAMATWQAGPFMTTALGICVAMAVVRLTRREEESGRTELLLAGDTGRLAPLLAATVQITGAAVLLSLVTVLPLIGGGGSALDLVTVFVQYLTVGLAAIGIALVAAEAAAGARTANLVSIAVVTGAYLVRGVADVLTGAAWLRWLSPMGWAQEMDPFGADRLLFALGAVALLGACLLAAAMIAHHRDIGSGWFARRRGPATGPGLRSLPRIVARLTAAPIAAYTAVTALYALVVGSLLPSVEQIAAGNEILEEVLVAADTGGALAAAFLAVMTSMLAAVAAAGGVMLVGRLGAEEKQGRTEVLLAGALSRTRYVAVQAAGALAGASVVLFGSAVAVSLSAGLAGMPWAATAADAFAAAGAQLPAAMVIVAGALFFYGLSTRLIAAAWALVAVSFLAGPIIGVFLGLPDWMVRLSPFSHAPMLPSESMRWPPVIVLTAIAAVLLTAGAASFARRDVG
ncbi:hypothetical protein GOHSU_21_00230 [Gordonia hirsuta DSM 44140 = NBRC 16056]|uniref:ABC transporter permease protein n=1 Tax=Gordonia hirsuta DSM 44140 = NBRC 16056 TaxID=1121927 RepID=L7L9X5_9ACTN|nr:hypothetical protein [Gordonia hirsuta]GAC57531.1 hypothetical protein GOHSU_21_00230 [Gordonia hirsuta DSM 44140 = NBRC 16056]